MTNTLTRTQKAAGMEREEWEGLLFHTHHIATSYPISSASGKYRTRFFLALTPQYTIEAD